MTTWEYKPVEDLCEILDSKRKPITKKDRIAGEIPYYGATGIVDYVEGFIFDEPLVLLGEDGAKWGSGENSAFSIEGKTWVNNHAHVLRPNREVIHDKWLIYYLNATDLMPFVSGMTVPKLNQRNLRQIEIPVPPLTEQKRIVEILDEAFEAIDQAKANIERNIQNAEELLKSKLTNDFENKRNGFITKRVGDIGKISMCKRVFKKETSLTGDIPFYKIGTFGKEPDAYIDSTLYENYISKYSYPKKGDVLISASGTIGRRVIFDGEPAYFQDSNIVWIDNDEELILNSLLYHFYAICDWNASRGATISRLYNDDLRRLEISFPIDKHKQQEMVSVFDQMVSDISMLEIVYQNKNIELNNLKKSLLQKAFSGDLLKKEAEA